MNQIAERAEDMADDAGLLQVDWHRDQETGAYTTDGASFGDDPIDQICTWSGGGVIGLGRPFYGQTLIVPVALIPTLVSVLEEMAKGVDG